MLLRFPATALGQLARCQFLAKACMAASRVAS
jgi:hypothetical protein